MFVISSKEIICTTEYLMLGEMYRINRCGYNRIQQYFYS
jgi:hypothetical protein